MQIKKVLRVGEWFDSCEKGKWEEKLEILGGPTFLLQVTWTVRMVCRSGGLFLQYSPLRI